MKIIKVAIIEDKKSFREVLKLLVNDEKDFQCEQDYSNGKAAISGIRHDQPDVVLVDLGLPDISGVECIETLKNEFPAIQFLVISISDDEEQIFEALTAGAEGYLTKDTNHSKIVESIKELLDGGAPMSASIARKVMRFFNTPNNELAEAYKKVLTKREVEILQHLIQGITYEKIGGRLFISMECVKSHCRNIYRKLHVESKNALISKIYSSNPMVFRLKEEVKSLKTKVQELETLLQEK